MARTSTTEISDGSPSLGDYINLANTIGQIGERNQRLQDRRKKILDETQTADLIKQWDGIDPSSPDFENTVSEYRNSENYNPRAEESATLFLLNRSDNWAKYDANLAEAELRQGLDRVGEARKVFLAGDEESARQMLAEINNSNPIINTKIEFDEGNTIHYFKKDTNDYVGSKPISTEDMFKIAVQLSQPNQYLGARVQQLGEIGKNNINAFLNADLYSNDDGEVLGKGYVKIDKVTGEGIPSFTFRDGTTVSGQEALDVMAGLYPAGSEDFKKNFAAGLAQSMTTTGDPKALKDYLTNRDQAIKQVLTNAIVREEPQKAAESIRFIESTIRKQTKAIPTDAATFIDQAYKIYDRAFTLTQENLSQKELEGKDITSKERDTVFKANVKLLIEQALNQQPSKGGGGVVGDALANLGKGTPAKSGKKTEDTLSISHTPTKLPTGKDIEKETRLSPLGSTVKTLDLDELGTQSLQFMKDVYKQ